VSRRSGPTDEQLRRLKSLRLAASLTLDTVADRTGLPVAHVEALEDARVEDLPAGPYVGAYYRLVQGVVGGGPDDVDPTLPEPPREPWLPLWAVRSVAFSSIAALLGVFAWQVQSGGLAGAVDVAEDMVASRDAHGPDQVLALTARREGRFRIEVDGDVVFDGVLPPGETRTFEANAEIAVELSGAEDARLEYNGQPIVPQGRQGVPRRLVFIDDLSPGG
jgi:hypothetical protein